MHESFYPCVYEYTPSSTSNIHLSFNRSIYSFYTIYSLVYFLAFILISANDAATEALNIAVAFDLKKEVEGANERLPNIRASLPAMENCPKVPACVDDDSVNIQVGASRDEEFERCLDELRLELRNHVIAEASD